MNIEEKLKETIASCAASAYLMVEPTILDIEVITRLSDTKAKITTDEGTISTGYYCERRMGDLEGWIENSAIEIVHTYQYLRHENRATKFNEILNATYLGQHGNYDYAGDLNDTLLLIQILLERHDIDAGVICDLLMSSVDGKIVASGICELWIEVAYDEYVKSKPTGDEK